MSVRLAAHRTVTLLAAASAALLADIPFTGLYASAASILAAAAVSAIGYATAPHLGART